MEARDEAGVSAGSHLHIAGEFGALKQLEDEPGWGSRSMAGGGDGVGPWGMMLEGRWSWVV